uniref:hypothetical protein n=2 Tax=Escherichia coli TaxID=562 RepID=UPI0021B258AA
MQTTRTPYSISFMATVLLLLLFACHSTVANAAVALGATRVIYPANQKQVLLCTENPQLGWGFRKAFSFEPVIKTPFDLLKHLAVWQL